jgi:uncharacterized spore protein YtfJ
VVIGSPIELGELTIVPISRISIGIGAGGGEGRGASPERRKKHGGFGSGKGTGGATGGAGKVRPVAVAVIREESVEVLPVDEKTGKLDRLLDKIPDLIERFKDA